MQFYHSYNRGIQKQKVFKDKNDYQTFMTLIDQYLQKDLTLEIFAFCLMPNHFHFLIFQEQKYSMSKFLQVISAEYTRKFNIRYKREGQLWQGTYRSVLIDTPEQFETVINYIHNNPKDLVRTPETYPYSSLGHKLGKFNINFMKKGRP